WTGMIVGFDHDDESIFDSQYEFLREARVVHSMVGMLTAIPKTPLYDRLLAEGRIDLEDPPQYGTNIVPKRMSAEALRDGFIALNRRLNEPAEFFGRADSLYHDPQFQFNRAQRAYWKGHRLAWFAARAKDLVRSAVLYRRLMR